MLRRRASKLPTHCGFVPCIGRKSTGHVRAMHEKWLNNFLKNPASCVSSKPHGNCLVYLRCSRKTCGETKDAQDDVLDLRSWEFPSSLHPEDAGKAFFLMV